MNEVISWVDLQIVWGSTSFGKNFAFMVPWNRLTLICSYRLSFYPGGFIDVIIVLMLDFDLLSNEFWMLGASLQGLKQPKTFRNASRTFFIR